MAGERHGVASWPGALAVVSCSYTLSHGITPGTAVLKILPQADYPDITGTLVIGDGADAITLPDCKITGLSVDRDGGGFVWTLRILDRRWKWVGLGQISGDYNLLDEHAKLLPWSIQSPTELAKLCLAAMGETNYTIDLPPGLDSAIGKKFFARNPPWIGVIPTTGTNPLIQWQNEPPAQALQNLCEQFGRRVIYRWATNSILIAIPGRGNVLPGGSIARESPSIDPAETPSGVGVIGAPTKYQARFLLEAVGEEWDGSFRTLDQLSYAPRVGGAVQISRARAAATGSNTFNVYIGPAGGDGLSSVKFSATSATASTAVHDLVFDINNSDDPRVKGVLTAAAAGAGDELVLTALKNGVEFFFYAYVDLPVTNTARFVAELFQAPAKPEADWRYCGPPHFIGIRATDRLTFVDALRLAQKTVHKYFRLSDAGVAANPAPAAAALAGGPLAAAQAGKIGKASPIIIPGYGKLKRRQQIILLPTKVEQVTPQPLDENLKNAIGQTIILNFYNGYSRDKPAVCYGSIASLRAPGTGFAVWEPNLRLTNSFATDQILFDFEIDPEQQLVMFSAPVYRQTANGIAAATPVLETGVYIRDADTNALDCFRKAVLLPGQSGNTNFAFRRFPDVQLNVIGDYDGTNAITGVRLLEADALMRANYYLQGLTAQYITAAADTREYNGIVAIDLDGAISQVTWNVGGNGATTIASVNTEHAIWFPPYPARRRAEFLGPAQQARLNEPQRTLGYAPFPTLGGS